MTPGPLQGEEHLVAACLAGARAAGANTTNLVLGPGDDAAILRTPPDHDLVWSTDEQVEDVHFRRSWAHELGFASLGTKAAGASLSDLAAMGATPLGALFSLRLPLELTEYAEALARGVGIQLAAAGCPLAGGNLVRAEHLGLSLGVLGTVPRGKGLRRDQAHPGDDLYVSGPLGWSALGLHWLESGQDPSDPQATRALEAFFHPRPRLALGRQLLSLPRVACLDLSDGLARDLPRLAAASQVQAQVSSGLLPCPSGDALLDRDATALAWSGGEDYQLLLAGPAADLDPIVGLTRIGKVRAGSGVLLDDQIVPGGHEHFPTTNRP